MAVIDRTQLVEDIKFWLPNGNVLSDAELLKIGNLVIAKIGIDDESVYDEALCKSIELAAIKNSSNTSITNTNVKKEKLGPLEIETYSNNITKDPWPNWIKNDLPMICAIIGYVPPEGKTARKYFDILIAPGDDIDIYEGQEYTNYRDNVLPL